MMKSKKRKIIVISILTFFSFLSSLICAVFGGVYLHNNPDETISYLFKKECEKQECGSMVFSSIQFENNETNINTINSMKSDFDESLHNQISLAEFNGSISNESFELNNVAIVSTDYYDENYDTMHIYSDTKWTAFNESDSAVYITSVLEKQIRSSLRIPSAIGLTINVSANGVTKNLTIKGTFLTDIYPRVKNEGCRGDGLINALGETILVHKNIILDFNPSKAIVMFSSNSSNNGKKYNSLNNSLKETSFQFVKNINPLRDSTLSQDLEASEVYFNTSKNIVAIILFITGTIIFTACLSVFLISLFRIIKPKNISYKQNAFLTSIIGIGTLLVGALILLVLKGKAFSVTKGVRIQMVNSFSLLLCLIPILTSVIILLIFERKIILFLFKERENNSEFDY